MTLLTTCKDHRRAAVDMDTARELVRQVRSGGLGGLNADSAAEVAFAVCARNTSDCPAGSFARYLVSAAWREI